MGWRTRVPAWDGCWDRSRLRRAGTTHDRDIDAADRGPRRRCVRIEHPRRDLHLHVGLGAVRELVRAKFNPRREALERRRTQPIRGLQSRVLPRREPVLDARCRDFRRRRVERDTIRHRRRRRRRRGTA